MEVTLGSRLARSAALYSTAWIAGAVLLSALHIVFPPRPARPEPDPKPHVTGAAPVSDPVPILTQGPIAWYSPLPVGGMSEPDFRVLARRMREGADHAAALNGLRPESRLAATGAKAENVAYFSECSRERNPRAWTRICTGDFIINLVNSMPARPDEFDWRTVQSRFGEGLVLALSNSVNSRPDPVIFQSNTVGYLTNSDTRPSYDLTEWGLLYQFGSNEVSRTLGDNGVKAAPAVIIEPDLEKAFQLYQRAADAGDANAQIMLGLAYKTGSGVARNDEEAIRLFRSAETQVPAAELLERQAASSVSPSGK